MIESEDSAVIGREINSDLVSLENEKSMIIINLAALAQPGGLQVNLSNEEVHMKDFDADDCSKSPAAKFGKPGSSDCNAESWGLSKTLVTINNLISTLKLKILSNETLENKSNQIPHPRIKQQGICVSREFIHSCLIHANDRKVDDSIRSGMVIGLEVSRKIKSNDKILPIKERCIYCAAGKIIRTPIYSTVKKADKILRRIHTDSKDLPCLSPEKDSICQVVVDEYTRYIELIFFKSHSQVSAKLFEVVDKWEIEQHPNKVCEIRSDSTKELEPDNKDYRAAIESRHNIIFSSSPPYVKEMNGLAERTIQTLQQTAITIQLQARLPRTLLKYALLHVARLSNILVHFKAGLPEKGQFYSPKYLWSNEITDISKEAPYGCQVTVHQHEDIRSAWDEPGNPGIYLGKHGSTIIWIYDLKRRLIYKAFHVVYHKDRFPGLTKNLEAIIDPYNQYTPQHPEPSQDEIDNYFIDESHDNDKGIELDSRNPVVDHEQLPVVPRYTLRSRSKSAPTTVAISGGEEEENCWFPYK